MKKKRTLISGKMNVCNKGKVKQWGMYIALLSYIKNKQKILSKNIPISADSVLKFFTWPFIWIAEHTCGRRNNFDIQVNRRMSYTSQHH